MANDAPLPSECAISARQISKTYVHARVGAMQSSLREVLTSCVRRPWRLLPGFAGRGHTDDVPALAPLDLTVARGEKLGLVGRNGSGKSTLLRILARITPPSTGTALIRGRVGAILEVGTGFHPELTGYENIFLNGAILGLKRRFVQERLDQIVAFAEVADLLDLPVKRYSSGMYVRLAFAVAAHLDCDVLLVDEVLAVGDQAFREKCLARMEALVAAGRTLVFVSHDRALMQRFCDRCVLLDRGQLLCDGAPEAVYARYAALDREPPAA